MNKREISPVSPIERIPSEIPKPTKDQPKITKKEKSEEFEKILEEVIKRNKEKEEKEKK